MKPRVHDRGGGGGKFKINMKSVMITGSRKTTIAKTIYYLVAKKNLNIIVILTRVNFEQAWS